MPSEDIFIDEKLLSVTLSHFNNVINKTGFPLIDNIA